MIELLEEEPELFLGPGVVMADDDRSRDVLDRGQITEKLGLKELPDMDSNHE